MAYKWMRGSSPEEFHAWMERRSAEQELRSALSDIKARADMLDIDLDTIDLPSAGKNALAGMSTSEIYAAAEGIRAEVRSAEYEYYNSLSEEATASELVEILLDLAGNKQAKNALRERLNADSSDINKLADELLSIDKPDRAAWLKSETADMIREQRKAEQSLLRSNEFMSRVEEDAKNWMR